MPCTLQSFPLVTQHEFDQACRDLSETFRRHEDAQNDWLAVEPIHALGPSFLRITAQSAATAGKSQHQHDTMASEIDELDDEILVKPTGSLLLMQYDIVLSPVYQVPVLYIDILDTEHRYPPTMDTLYKHVIPPQYKSQTENVGVIGGITINHHPVSNKPMFFIHPCQTADVMKAVVGEKVIDAAKYLILFIGAMGKCIGLNVPLALVKDHSTHYAEIQNT